MLLDLFPENFQAFELEKILRIYLDRQENYWLQLFKIYAKHGLRYNEYDFSAPTKILNVNNTPNFEQYEAENTRIIYEEITQKYGIQL
jgi:hypothetical protein